MRLRREAGEVVQALLGQILHRGVKCAHRAAQKHLMRQDIMAVGIAAQGADRNDDLFQRVGVAAGDGLQRDQHMGGSEVGVDGLMRGRGMAALPGQRDVELIRRSQQRALADCEMPGGVAGHIVHAVNLIDIPTVHQPLLNHDIATAAAFLGGLEDQHDAAIEIARLRKVLCSTQQHRRMPIMAAGMHFAGGLRGIGQPRRFHDRQRIHIGAQPDGAV